MNLLRTAQITLRAKYYMRIFSSLLVIGSYVLLFWFSWKVAVGVCLLDWGRRLEKA